MNEVLNGDNSDELDFELETEGFTTEDALPSTGGGCDKPGRYHVHVADVRAEGRDNKTPCIRLDFEILAGDHEDQIGKKIYLRIYTKKAKREEQEVDGKKKSIIVGFEPISEFSRKQMLKIAFGLQLLGEDQIGQKLRISWAGAAGAQAIVQVDAETEERNGKEYTSHRILWGNVWNPDHEEVTDVPRDAEAMVMFRSGAGGGGGDVLDGI